MDKIKVLWDGSYLWGLMLWHSIQSLNLPCQLINAIEIAQGAVLGKPKGVLIVPGGSSRLKALSLTPKGLTNIKKWVEDGGNYIGICGGAGLALRSTDKSPGIGLSVWKRGEFKDRLNHLLSGYVEADYHCQKVSLPVWWPARFDPEPSSSQEILATLKSLTRNTWLGDCPINPDDFQNEHFMDQPLIIRGKHGRGEFILSYAHLETPNSPDANNMFYDILFNLADIFFNDNYKAKVIPEWDLEYYDIKNDVFESVAANASSSCNLREFMNLQTLKLHKIFLLGTQNNLFFPRKAWLYGWKNGLPGIALNHLGAFCKVLSILPDKDNLNRYWTKKCDFFKSVFQQFFFETEQYLLNVINHKKQGNKTAKIFGHPMFGGGMIDTLLKELEIMIYLAQ